MRLFWRSPTVSGRAIDRERVNDVELPGPLPGSLQERAVLPNFDARIADGRAATGVAIAHENVAVTTATSVGASNSSVPFRRRPSCRVIRTLPSDGLSQHLMAAVVAPEGPPDPPSAAG